MKKEVFKAIQDQLTTLTQIQYVGEDWGQLDFYAERPPLLFPCVLFDADEADYKDAGQRSQDGIGSVTIRIADSKPVNVSALSARKAQPLEMYDTVSEVYKALQGLQGETFSGLTRVKLMRARREDGIREFQMTFRFGFVDDSATRQYRSVPVTPQIQGLS